MLSRRGHIIIYYFHKNSAFIIITIMFILIHFFFFYSVHLNPHSNSRSTSRVGRAFPPRTIVSSHPSVIPVLGGGEGSRYSVSLYTPARLTAMDTRTRVVDFSRHSGKKNSRKPSTENHSLVIQQSVNTVRSVRSFIVSR